jgi:branched-chain amino acid aminotransferase
MSFFIFNNKFYKEKTLIISSGNRSFRYGDGLFETMKFINARIPNEEFHFERLFNGLSLLQFDVPKNFNHAFLQKKIKELLNKNKHTKVARIRLVVFRGNGGIFDPENLFPNYIIETWPIEDQIKLNENGLVVDIFADIQKSCDSFSNLKSNNYLPYVMAGLFAKKNKLNDCIILNSFGRICDSAIANVFIVDGNNIYTPPLTEGCVAGIMRRWMMERFSLKKYKVIEKNLSIEDLLNADELFLTNSISYMRWVKTFRDKNYTNEKVKEIYQHILKNI